MKIEDYILLYTSNIRTTIKNNPTDFTETSLSQVLIDSINRLKEFRLDKWATEEEITTILKDYKKPRRTFNGEIDHYEDTVDSNVLSFMLLKYCKREKSFYYAYIRLQQEVNRRIAIPEDIHFLSEQEIEDAVLKDMASSLSIEQKKEEQFVDLLIHEDKDGLMKLLHQLLDYKKGKDVVVVIKAMESLQILKPYTSISSLHVTLTEEFGDVGGLRNFSNYMSGTSDCHIQNTDIQKYIAIIKKV